MIFVKDQNSSADEVMLSSPIMLVPPVPLTTATSLQSHTFLPTVRHAEEREGQQKEGAPPVGRGTREGKNQRNKSIHIKRGKLLGEEKCKLALCMQCKAASRRCLLGPTESVLISEVS